MILRRHPLLLAVAAATALASAAASAAPVTWRLVGVRFADGGTATGSLVHEAANQSVPAWNVSVRGGDTGSFAPLTYSPASGSALTYLGNGSARTLALQQSGSVRQMRLTPTAPLTDAGGALGLALAVNSGNLECFNCFPTRLMTAGSLVAEDASGDALRFGEILFDPPGNLDSPNEFIELVGAASATIGPNTYVVAVDGDEGSTGIIHTVFDISGRQFGSNGRLVLAPAGFPLPVDPAATLVQGTGPGFIGMPGFSAQGGANSIANGSSTFFLVRAVTPPQPSDDIDGNNDGVVDLSAAQSGWLVFDAVGVLDGGIADRAYAPANFSPGGGTSTTGPVTIVQAAPGYVARLVDIPDPDAAAWVTAAVTGEAPAFRLFAASPSCFEGSALSDIGAANPDCPVGIFADGFEPPP